ncbi:MAG: DHH family phosphoesterase [Candidatus Portnoybacteria bacterium]|nr:DHH family phosphoesterase [Candidatus Portnoybacteria bacterium]
MKEGKYKKSLVSDGEKQQFEEKINNLPGDKRIACITHRNADPDTINSAFALQELVDRRGIKADIFVSSMNKHPQNIAIINHFGMELQDELFWEKNKSNYGLVIFCDCGMNNAAINVMPNIIIDHHHENSICEECLVIKKRTGANATIIYYLLKKLGFEFVYPDPLATALAVAIEIDTKSLSKADENAEFNFDAEALRELIFLGDYSTFKHLAEHYELTKGFFGALGLDTEKIFSGCLALCGIGHIKDAQQYCIPVIADWLLRVGQAHLAVVIGIVDDQYIKVSIRTDHESNVQISQFCKDVFGVDIKDKDSSGARGGSAGAMILLSARDQEKLACANPEQKQTSFDLEMERYRLRIKANVADA